MLSKKKKREEEPPTTAPAEPVRAPTLTIASPPPANDDSPAEGRVGNADPILASNRLANVNVPHGPRSTVTWNAHEWDVRG